VSASKSDLFTGLEQMGTIRKPQVRFLTISDTERNSLGQRIST